MMFRVKVYNYFHRFWEYDSTNILSTGSLDKYGLSGLSNLNAVFTFEKTPATYFFQGTQYWRYNERAKKITGRYPQTISPAWPGVVNNLDAAVTWINKKSYIFKGEYYYKVKVNRRSRRRNRGKITVMNGYPRRTDQVWMRCAKS